MAQQPLLGASMTTASVDVPGCCLAWSLIDLTPPWLTEPETIVMHHGIGASQHLFDAWLPALINRFRILRFDIRGHGKSDRPSPGKPFNLNRLTDDLFAVMDAAGVPTAHLVGESIGGTVALNAALREPGRFRTLTVSNGAHLGASIQAVAGWHAMIETEGMAAWSAFMMRGRFYPGALSPDLLRWFQDQQATACPHTVLNMLNALVGADLTEQLPNLKPPLMLLHPDDSPFIPVAVMADLHNRVPGSRLNVVGNARHGLPFSHADVCSRLLGDFLSQQTL